MTSLIRLGTIKRKTWRFSIKSVKVFKNKAKLILITLTAVMLMSVCAFIGCSDSEDPPAGAGIVYELKSDNTYMVKDYTGEEAAIVIPDTYEGLPVTEIGSGAFNRLETLNEITIPESIVKINDLAFTNCRHLKKVNYNAKKLDEGFESNSGPFRYNTLSSSVAAPTELVVNIGANVEEIPASIFDSVGVTELNFAENSKCTAIEKHAFSNAQITALNLPNGLKSLGYGAFSICEKLVSVSLPSTIEHIDTNVFYACEKISGNAFENGIYIGNSDNPYLALYSTTYDSEHKVVNVHENTKFVLSYAIDDDFYSVNLPDGLIGVCGYSIDSNNMSSIIIPASVKYMGSHVFDGIAAQFLIVNCEAKTKPDGWESDWYKTTNYPHQVKGIYWGYGA